RQGPAKVWIHAITRWSACRLRHRRRSPRHWRRPRQSCPGTDGAPRGPGPAGAGTEGRSMADGPLIGISTYAEPGVRWGAWQLDAALLPAGYPQVVQRAGGLVA